MKSSRSHRVSINPVVHATTTTQGNPPVRTFFDDQFRENIRPLGSVMLWSKGVHTKRRCSCTRLEIFLLLLTIVLIGLLAACLIVWLALFNGYKLLNIDLLKWNSGNIVSVSSSIPFIAIDSSAGYTNYKVCTSRECSKIAALFSTNIDERVNPCDDIYAFACNNYKSAHEPGFHSTITDLQSALFKKLKRILESRVTSEDKPWERLPKAFYNKCVDEARIEKLGRVPLKDLLNQVGGWPLLHDRWQEFPQKWEEHLASVLNKTGIASMLLEINVSHDPENSFATVIELDQPKLESNMPYLADNNNPIRLKHIKLMTELATQMDANATKIEKDVASVVDLEMNLAVIATDETQRNDLERTNNRFQMQDLQDLFPDIDLNAYIKAVFKDKMRINENDTVVVRELGYFRGLQQILKFTSKRTIANYIGWRLIQSFSPFLLKRDRQLFVKHKIDSRHEFETSEVKRWETCVSISLALLSIPVGKLFVEAVGDTGFAAKKATQIIDHLKAAFIENVEQLEWIESKARERVIQKAKAITYNVGYPQAMFNESWMLEHWNYNHYNDENESLLGLAVRLKRSQLFTELSRFKQPVDKNSWYQSPAQVDAFYSPHLNQITIPFAIMQYPFLSQNVPNYVIFAMLGTIISHEFSHAFCSHGSKYDGEGNLKAWWDSGSVRNYKDRAECFVRQYEQAGLKSHSNRYFHLSENLADNTALKFAYKAYNLWKEETGEIEPILPGFQNYTNNQMFFISYVNNWCSSVMKISKQTSADSHTVFFLRAKIPLQNLDDFSTAFTCSIGNPMNPSQKCSVW